MSYNEIPWTVTEEPKAIKEKRKEIQLKEIQSKIEENIPVAVARIIKFLNKNKNQSYTNTQIAQAIGVKSVSGIMDKLEEIGAVKIVKIRKGTKAGISQVYQSGLGISGKVKKERMTESLISKTLALFYKNTNKVYSKADIAKDLQVSKDKLSESLSILLVSANIKLVGIKGKDTLLYQSIKGNKAAIEISGEPNSSYTTLQNYIKSYNIKGSMKKIKPSLAKEKGHSRLFYSDKGIVKEYEISYLQKVIGLGSVQKKEKKLLERIKIW